MMMAEKYDPLPDVGALVHAALWGQHDVTSIADRLTDRLGLGEDDSPATVTAELRKALGIPVPATLADPASCTHPPQSLSTVTDHGTFDWTYVVCAACLSEYLTCDGDCRGECPCDGVTLPAWRPVTEPDHVPAQVLTALGMTRDSDDLRGFLRGRVDGTVS